MLTIAQTCQYRGLSFVDFLRGKVGLFEAVHASVLPGYLPYKVARVYVAKLRLQTKYEWLDWIGKLKKPGYIPGNSVTVYAESWKGWEECLGGEGGDEAETEKTPKGIITWEINLEIIQKYCIIY